MKQLRLSLELEQLELALQAERSRHATRQLSMLVRVKRLMQEIATSLKQNSTLSVIRGKGVRGMGARK